MDRLQFAKRPDNTNKAAEIARNNREKLKKESKVFYEKSCPKCGHRNKCSWNQKNVVCERISCRFE